MVLTFLIEKKSERDTHTLTHRVRKRDRDRVKVRKRERERESKRATNLINGQEIIKLQAK